MNEVGFSQQAIITEHAKLDKALGDIKFGGRFVIEHHRGGKIIDKYEVTNGVTNQGKSNALDVLFSSGTQITAWYLSLIGYVLTTAPAATDTMAVHPLWTEYTNYVDVVNSNSATTRPAWVAVAPSAGITTIKNNVVAEFKMVIGGGTAQIYGLFCTDEQTKGGSGSGKILWATAPFSSPVTVANDDVLKMTYVVNVTGA